MRKEDKVFKTIFFIWGYHLYVTIPLRNKFSFMFKVIECGKDCREIEIYLMDYMRFKKTYKPHKFYIKDGLVIFLTNIKESNIINWEVLVKRKSLAYQNKWKSIYFRKFFRNY